MQNHTWQLTEALRPLVVQLEFQRNNRTVFKSVNYAGYVGVLTGLKGRRFSVSLDRRFHWDGGVVAVIRWLLGFDQSAALTGLLLRNVLDQADGYDQALDTLVNVALIAPAYFIVGGNSSGQVNNNDL